MTDTGGASAVSVPPTPSASINTDTAATTTRPATVVRVPLVIFGAELARDFEQSRVVESDASALFTKREEGEKCSVTDVCFWPYLLLGG